jgi:hypothetical protein
MGPHESPTSHPENQEADRRKRLAHRPRMRRCLLKGCVQRFHPRQAHLRYCSERCREAARKWSRRKAQERYRETAAGQQKRNCQSRRYRERIKSRKPPDAEAVSGAARVISTEDFFSTIAVTGQAATSDSNASGEVLCSASVRTCAGARWNGSKSGSGAGNELAI